MKLTELKILLGGNPDAQIRFQLPDGSLVPIHAHVTEVARIDKRFIDCGGTLRTDAFCRLQTWFSDDLDHRLTAGKLAGILSKAGTVLLTDELEVDIEHELGRISQFPLENLELVGGEIIFRLAERHTDCLAKDQCKPAAAPSEFSPLKFNFTGSPATGRCC